MSVLIVENDPDCAEVLECMTRGDGANSDIWVASDGPEALKIVERESPRIIFSELSLPRLNGLDLAARIRRMPDAESKYLCVVTGFPGSRYFESAIESGYDHYVLKPYDMKEIKKILSCAP